MLGFTGVCQHIWLKPKILYPEKPTIDYQGHRYPAFPEKSASKQAQTMGMARNMREPGGEL
jgi:hypothetical protein